MYNDYAFKLEWSEISDELQNEKIEAYITHNWEQGEYQDDEGEKRPLEEVMDDHYIWHTAEKAIEARFPIYF